MRLLLDTNQLLFLAQEPNRISPQATLLFHSADHEFFFSSVSIWEIDIKNRALTADGRSRLPLKTDLSNMIGFFLEKDFSLWT
jgi:PIN domain nuclease of toxin-antitoxin system